MYSIHGRPKSSGSATSVTFVKHSHRSTGNAPVVPEVPVVPVVPVVPLIKPVVPVVPLIKPVVPEVPVVTGAGHSKTGRDKPHSAQLSMSFLMTNAGPCGRTVLAAVSFKQIVILLQV